MTNEIVRILRDFGPEALAREIAQKNDAEQSKPESEQAANNSSSQTPISPNSALYGSGKKVAGDIKFEPFTKDYPDQCTVEEFVLDVAIHCNRSAEKAAEWIRRLKAQDIDTVGDLHRLQEDDWIKLNLTVFATRALRNALAGRQVAAAMTSPRNNPGDTVLSDH